jgi:hypothetical protein
LLILEVREVHRPEKNCILGSREEFHALVLVVLSPIAHRDPERTADWLAKHKGVESVDILAGNWDLALEVKKKEWFSILGRCFRIAC